MLRLRMEVWSRAAASTPQFLHENGIRAGSPREVIATMQRFARVGFDQFVVVPAIGWTMPHARVLESIRVMGEEVLPALRA